MGTKATKTEIITELALALVLMSPIWLATVLYIAGIIS